MGFEASMGGGGTITGGGTLNFIPKFNPSGTALGDSLLFDNGVAIGLGTILPNSSSVFDISSTTKGFLLPRMTSAQRNAIGAPADGLLIYNTGTTLFNYWDGTTWQAIDSTATSEWLLDGNSNGVIKYIGTNDAFDFPIYVNGAEVARYTVAGNFGVGITPLARIHIFGVDATSLVNQRLEPVASVTEDTTGSTINTSGAVTSTLQTIAIPTDSVVMIVSNVTARKTAGIGAGLVGDGNGYIRTVKAQNIAGVVTIGVVQTSFTSEEIAGLGATFVVSGTDVDLDVTNVIDDDVTWNSVTQTYKV